MSSTTTSRSPGSRRQITECEGYALVVIVEDLLNELDAFQIQRLRRRCVDQFNELEIVVA